MKILRLSKINYPILSESRLQLHQMFILKWWKRRKRSVWRETLTIVSLIKLRKIWRMTSLPFLKWLRNSAKKSKGSSKSSKLRITEETQKLRKISSHLKRRRPCSKNRKFVFRTLKLMIQTHTRKQKLSYLMIRLKKWWVLLKSILKCTKQRL